MTDTPQNALTGRKVLAITCAAFAVIIGVNFTLAYKAVSTFPGLEVKNSYVASQGFDAARDAQIALGWDVAATLQDGTLRLSFERDGQPVTPKIISAILGRATSVADDLSPDFTWDGSAFVAHPRLGPGNWNLRLVAEADDGTTFRQRIVVKVLK